MKSRPLVLDDRTRAEIKRVMDFAEANRIDIHRLFRIVKGNEKTAGDYPGHCCVVPIGYLCVYSIEQQPDFWTRHLSVSVDGAGCSPNERAVLELALEFGFKSTGKGFVGAGAVEAFAGVDPRFVELVSSPDTEMWLEEIGGDKRHLAINLIQKL